MGRSEKCPESIYLEESSFSLGDCFILSGDLRSESRKMCWCRCRQCGMQTESAECPDVTSHHQAGRHRDHRHGVLGHTAVVAGVLAGQVGDGQQAGHLVNASDAGGLVTLHGAAVPEPGDQHGRVPLGHEAGLPQSLALNIIIAEHEVLNFGCN